MRGTTGRFMAAVLALAFLAGSMVALGPGPAHAQNAAFQGFFTNACGGAAGGLATLCGVNTDLSGDSESSLNPNQTVSAAAAALAAAKERTRA